MSVHAQKKWSVEVRTSLNFTTQTPYDKSIIGYGFEARTFFLFAPHLSAYTGWCWNIFPAELKSDYNYEESGFNFGLQYTHFTSAGSFHYFIAAGGFYAQLETENKFYDFRKNSGYKAGWQTECGVGFLLAKKVKIRPGLRYRNFTSAGISYLSLGVGIEY